MNSSSMDLRQLVSDSVVVLAGDPCSGKTSTAQALARILGCSACDVDAEIESQTQLTVSEIFRKNGELEFREIEFDTFKSLVAKRVPVISLGGGALAQPALLDFIKATDYVRLFVLRGQAETLWRRASADESENAQGAQPIKRPLISSGPESLRSGQARQNLDRLLAKRSPVFSGLPCNIWTDWSEPELTAALLGKLQPMCKELSAEQSCFIPHRLGFPEGHESLVAIGTGISSAMLSNLNSLISAESDIVGLLIDANVAKHWQGEFTQAIQAGGLRVAVCEVPSGEASKNLGEVERIANFFVESGVSREDTIVGVGGGVVGDLAGLLASVYLRGVKLVQVATSLVAQVDSAIGGKTAVNLSSGKNLIGTFYPADLIICDLLHLKTLPKREFISGLAEVAKYGLIADADFWNWLRLNRSAILALDNDVIFHMVTKCVLSKLNHVMEDLLDRSGLRAKLNFGHTIGHALESLLGYGTLLHGEAVSIGMVMEMRIGEKLKITESGLSSEASELLGAFGLPTKMPQDLNPLAESNLVKGNDDFANTESSIDLLEKWRKSLLADKKRASDVLKNVFLEKIGIAKTHRCEVGEMLEKIGSTYCVG